MDYINKNCDPDSTLITYSRRLLKNAWITFYD